VPDFLASGELKPRASIATLASAMDVGLPSNLERLLALHPDAAALGAAITAVSVSDEQIRARIRADNARFGTIWCPHTAVAAEAWAQLPAAEQAARRWVLVGTAHAAKFAEIVQPLVSQPLTVPENLARLFQRPTRSVEIAATLTALREAIQS
jgi:threonine synthase